MPHHNYKYAEQRVHDRHKCRCYATLYSTNEVWPGHLINISKTGALVAILTKHNLNTGERIEFKIKISEVDSLKLNASIVHVNEHYLGLEYTAVNEENHAKLEQVLTTNGFHYP